MDPNKALETLQKRYKKQNEWMKENYKRVSITIPNATFERLQAVSDESLNGLFNRLLLEYIQAKENKKN